MGPLTRPRGRHKGSRCSRSGGPAAPGFDHARRSRIALATRTERERRTRPEGPILLGPHGGVDVRARFRTPRTSGTHLFMPGCRAEDPSRFLKQIECERLDPVGDILDAWHLQRLLDHLAAAVPPGIRRVEADEVQWMQTGPWSSRSPADSSDRSRSIPPRVTIGSSADSGAARHESPGKPRGGRRTLGIPGMQTGGESGQPTSLGLPRSESRPGPGRNTHAP